MTRPGDYSPAQGPAVGAIGSGLISEKAYINAQNQLKQSQYSTSDVPQAPPQSVAQLIESNQEQAYRLRSCAGALREKLQGGSMPEANEAIRQSFGPTKDSLITASLLHAETERDLSWIFDF